MKPNETQKKVCELIKSTASFWMNSNDIDSPTHICDIEEEVEDLDCLEDDDKDDLIECLDNLYRNVRRLKYVIYK